MLVIIMFGLNRPAAHLLYVQIAIVPLFAAKAFARSILSAFKM